MKIDQNCLRILLMSSDFGWHRNPRVQKLRKLNLRGGKKGHFADFAGKFEFGGQRTLRGRAGSGQESGHHSAGGPLELLKRWVGMPAKI